MLATDCSTCIDYKMRRTT